MRKHRGFNDNTEAPQLAEHAQSVVRLIEMHLEEARSLVGGTAAPC